MKKILIAASFLSLIWAISSAQPKPQQEASLSLAISPPGTKYVEGESLPIKLTFKNVSKKSMKFTLAEKDKDPPGFIWARVWDAQGRLLTTNKTLSDGWWTVWVMSSSMYKEKESDQIALKPGEEYMRTVDLRGLLAGCECLPSGLEAGKYRVQFSLGNVVSNELEIRIEK